MLFKSVKYNIWNIQAEQIVADIISSYKIIYIEIHTSRPYHWKVVYEVETFFYEVETSGSLNMYSFVPYLKNIDVWRIIGEIPKKCY